MTKPVALATTVWGDGPRRALLLHGLTSAASTWWRVADALVELDFTVVAPDLRAHGRSPRGDNLSIDSYRDDVLLLGNGWDLLVGHSLGGAIAAAAMATRPDFAKRVILEDPAIDSAVTAAFVVDSPEPLINPTVAAVAAEHPNWHPRDVELKVEALLACAPLVSVHTLADAAPWDIWPDILGSDTPTLIVAADPKLGTLVSAEKASQVAERGGAVRLVRIPGSGHSLHRDALDRFVPLLQKFLVA